MADPGTGTGLRGHKAVWLDAFDLRVVKAVARRLADRWGMRIVFVDGRGHRLAEPDGPDSRACPQPGVRPTDAALCERFYAEVLARVRDGRQGDAAGCFTCPAGVEVLARPVRLDGKVAGAVAALGAHEPTVEGTPRPGSRNGGGETTIGDPGTVVSVSEMLQVVAEELAGFKSEMDQRERRLGLVAEKVLKGYESIVGRSPAMIEVFRLMDKVVRTESTVLVHGENGTGKELVARAIHQNSPRANRRFVTQNCSALNDNLLDSELFGHKRGAFTGAVSDKDGLFQVAHLGTLFLDEVGDMSPALQVKLLRVLQEGTFTPVGSTEERKVDVRIIAATNKDLAALTERGLFRQDLFFRLDVIALRIPPLRERKPDIPLLVDHFLAKNARGRRVRMKRVSRPCLERMMEYDWPGNVRELENEVERLTVLAGSEHVIEQDLLSPRIRQGPPRSGRKGLSAKHSLPDAVEALERSMIYDVLCRTRWNKTRAAQELNISRRNLIRKVRKYGLDRRRSR